MSTNVDGTTRAIALRIKQERATRDWSLADLAARAAVSKAMLSKIERVEVSPTAVILSRIATAFGLTLAALVDDAADRSRKVLRAKDQPVWRDPKTSYLRRQVFLSQTNPLELVEIELPVGQEVSFPASAYLLIRQVAWVVSGHLTIVLGGERHDLSPGDRIEFGAPADCAFRNESARPCRYVVAVVRN